MENNLDANFAAEYLIRQEKILGSSSFVSWTPLDKCCQETVESHAQINSMMVCGVCRHIIKCFTEERPYKNFLTFCHTRGRNVRATRSGNLLMVVYKSHGNV